ncbi:unnamed protein product, partial [Closterium sp. Naga37s-1]
HSCELSGAAKARAFLEEPCSPTINSQPPLPLLPPGPPTIPQPATFGIYHATGSRHLGRPHSDPPPTTPQANAGRRRRGRARGEEGLSSTPPPPNLLQATLTWAHHPSFPPLMNPRLCRHTVEVPPAQSFPTNIWLPLKMTPSPLGWR